MFAHANDCNRCVENPESEEDGILPGDMEEFINVMVGCMPTRLTVDTWIAELILRQASSTMNGGGFDRGHEGIVQEAVEEAVEDLMDVS